MMVDFATIQVHKETKERIAALRGPGESFDTALRRLLEHSVREAEDAFLRELNAEIEKGDFVPWDDVWASTS